MNPHRTLLNRHWTCANARDWTGFARTLHPDVRYRVPQTREVLHGADALTAFYASYPGDWTLSLVTCLVDGDQAVTTTDFRIGADRMTGITFFELRDGLVWRIDDWWPAPYDPPARVVPMQRDDPEESAR